MKIVREWLNLPEKAKIPRALVGEIRVGSTICTNALLERRGEKTAVAVTKGFRDALVIGDQTRPALFDLAPRRPPPLWARAAEIDERTGANGEVVRAPSPAAAAAQLQKLRARGFRTLAVAFVHGCKYPRHEKIVTRIARKIGFQTVVPSHEAAALMKFIPRAQTAAADAYLAAALAQWSRALRQKCESGVRLLFMHSGGDLAEIQNTRAVQTVLSGPAGGVVGMRRAAQNAGCKLALGVDMGGTSTDVALADAAAPPALRWENTVAGAPLFAPMLDIHTVAAGGGSVVRWQDGRLLVGPRSAGANPGPACYGRGGPLTVSDCNVVLGKLRAEYFPQVFGESGNSPLCEESARRLFADLGKKTGADPQTLALGFVRVAVENMAGAARRIAAASGADIRKRALVGFGGAAGQHLCLLAESLGIRRALAPRQACVLSAWGIGQASVGAIRRRALECEVDDNRLPQIFAELCAEAEAALPPDAPGKRTVRRFLRCRYRGVESALAVQWQPGARIAELFVREHRKRFGWIQPKKEILAAAAEVRAAAADHSPPATVAAGGTVREAKTGEHPVRCAQGEIQTPFYDWRKLPPAAKIKGPAVIADKWNTITIEPHWQAQQSPDGTLTLTHTPRRLNLYPPPLAGGGRSLPSPSQMGTANSGGVASPSKQITPPPPPPSKMEGGISPLKQINPPISDGGGWGGETPKKETTKPDPALLEIFNNRFTAAAREMGEALRQTATSVNIRERLDFSCAIFDGNGNLVANAPHIPVHLGSMSESARFVLRNAGKMREGDCFMLNSPYAGGTHLPDITIIRPLWLTKQNKSTPPPSLMGGLGGGKTPTSS